MIQSIRSNTFIRVFWVMMAGYLLNISVDIADDTPQGVSENLLINEQESLIELVLEHALDCENAIPEHDGPGADDQHEKNGSKSLVFPMPIIASELVFFKLFSRTSYLIIDQLVHLIEFVEMDSPPPDS